MTCPFVFQAPLRRQVTRLQHNLHRIHTFYSIALKSFNRILICVSSTSQPRLQVREMYGISEQESCCGSDCVTSHFCAACDLVQVSRQLRLQAPDVNK
jgi:Cys-rich protein (TIGR01571 family)